MIACTRSGLVPKVGGISADSSTPRRPLVPAPTKMIRPCLRSAWVMISTPTAMRSFSRWTARSIFRSSFSMPSTMSAGESLSIASVAGLICSVGRDCHFERTGMRSRPQEQAADTIIVVGHWSLVMNRAAPVDEYLDHLRVERRLAAHTLESYARDLTALGEFAAGHEQAVERLDRRALESFVRQQMNRGLAPRSVARRVAAARGFYKFLVLDQRIERSPADDLAPPRAWPS